VKEKQGIYRFPRAQDPGQGPTSATSAFELEGKRLVVVSAIDNLMKGAAGQAVHAMNVNETALKKQQVFHLPGSTRSDMCRLLVARSQDAFPPAPYLEKFASIAKNSKEFQARLGVRLVGSGRSLADLPEHPTRVGR